MKIEEFWVVTKPTKESILEDICFKTTALGFVRQVVGGLRELDDPTFYTDEGEAVIHATNLLDKRVVVEGGK